MQVRPHFSEWGLLHLGRCSTGSSTERYDTACQRATLGGTGLRKLDDSRSLSRYGWSLYWRDRNLKFHRYDRVASTPTIQVLLDEITADPTSIFWG